MPRLSENINELTVYVQRVADAIGIPEAHVEKDFWLTQAMRACVDVAAPDGVEVILKGGTSLSKAHGLIHRFSEDVDIILVFPDGASLKARHSLMKRIADDAAKALQCEPQVDNTRSETGVKRPVTLQYPSASASGAAGLRGEGVLLELGTREGPQPSAPAELRPLIAEHAAALGLPSEFEDFEPVSIRVLDPARTLVEKLLILHEAAIGGDEVRIRDVARHYYDVHQLLGDPTTRAAVDEHGVAQMVDDVGARSGAAGLPVIEPPTEGLAASPAFDAESAAIAKDQYDSVVVPQFLWPGAETPSFEDCCARVRQYESLLS